MAIKTVHIVAAYEFRTWLAPPEEIRELTIELQPFQCWICARNITSAKWWNSCIGSGYVAYLCGICFRNLPRPNWWNSCIGSRHAAHLCWIWAPNMTWANWRNAWRNMIREKWWNKLHMYPIAPQCVFLTRVAPTENIRVIALVVHPNCAAYVLEKWLALKWWNTFIGAKHLVSFISITLLRRLGRNHSPVRKFLFGKSRIFLPLSKHIEVLCSRLHILIHLSCTICRAHIRNIQLVESQCTNYFICPELCLQHIYTLCGGTMHEFLHLARSCF